VTRRVKHLIINGLAGFVTFIQDWTAGVFA